MWFSDSVEIPDEVVTAAGDGSLVIFVGAGASIAPPSSLPTFDELAAGVAKDLRATMPGKIGPDAFLEQLELQELPMRAQVLARLGNPMSLPNDYHRALVRLFPNLESLRIVTTNYDPHLTSAATDHFGATPPVYRAPALPLGRDFHGIVYVHGDLVGRPEDLVITSRDFGRAYLTDAWAARFLIELFSSYVTLFVGYSHNDIVMSYLARGLRPGSRRFGLTANPDAAEEWRGMELVPVLYPYTVDHVKLLEAITNWADFAEMGLLDHEQQVALRLDNPPPIAPAETSYLERVLIGDVTARYFTENAKSIEWLDWAVDRQPFPSLLRRGVKLTPAAFVLSYWFAGFVGTESDHTLGIVQQHGGMLNEETAFAIAIALRANRPDAKTLGRWVALLTILQDRDVDRSLAGLLVSSRWPEDQDVAILLFDHLIRRVVELRPSLHMTGTYVGPSVEFAADNLAVSESLLSAAWREYFTPHLAEIAPRLMPILQYHLSSAHELLRTVGQAGDQWDSQSFRRSAIEPDPQDQIAWPYAFVIDCVRDCIEALVEHDPDYAISWIGVLVRSNAPLLRRLAVFAWTERQDVSAAEKIEHAISEGWLFKFATKHEVYQLIAAALPEALATRPGLLEAILLGPTGDDALEDDRINRQLVLDLLAHVAQVGSPFPEALAAIENLEDTHTGLQPSAHLGFDSWIGPSGFGTTYPVSVEELLACRTAAEIEALVSHATSVDPNAAAWDFRLPDAIATAAAQRPLWALEILRDLLAASGWGSPYWDHLFAGLSRLGAQLDDALVRAVCNLLADVLGILPDQPELGHLLRPVAEWLMNVVHRSAIDAEVLDTLESIGERVAKSVPLGPSDYISVEPEGVLDRAYNNWTGWFARFWVDATSHHWQLYEAEWTGLPERIRRSLEAIVSAASPLDVYPQSILAAKYDFFAGADEAWTLEHLRPLFEWERDTETAARAWSSFVDGGTLTERILGHLRTDFRPAFSTLRGKLGVAFAKRFAEVMVRSKADYVSDGTLADFIANADEEMRVAFARQVGWLLVHHMPRTYGEEQWTRWILEYLSERIALRPRAFSVDEAAAVLDWVVAAGSNLPDAVALYVQSPAEFSETYGFSNDLERHHVIEFHPLAGAQLVDFVLARTSGTMFWCEQLGSVIPELLERLDEDARPVLLHICESAARLQCPDAPSWRLAIEGRWPT